jgi:NTE family protein
MNPQAPQKLSAAQVKMLALEGGGGKGAAYLGALGVLADPKVALLKATNDNRTEGATIDKTKITKISGSSAGAITATLLACGYSLDDILTVVTSSKLLEFYDPPKLYRPHVAAKLPRAEFYAPSLSPTGTGPFQKVEEERARERFKSAPVTVANVILHSFMSFLDYFYEGSVTIKDFPTPLQIILENRERFEQYVISLTVDYGLMSGLGARKFIDNLIARKTVIGGIATQSSTFQEFVRHYGIQLYLTGSHLETGTCHYFSAETTPYFRVADAVRISMSIPILFKPVVIRKGDFPGDELVGTWVDGGLLNNFPLHAFDSDQGAVNPSVLGLRLGLDTPRQIEGLPDFVNALAGALLAAGELGQIRTLQEQLQTIVLPIGGLSTVEFLAKPNVLRDAVKQSAMATMRYFGLSETTSSFLNSRFGISKLEMEPILVPT